MTTYLLDANVLIALTIADHEHHDLVSAWASQGQRFALCPIVEGSLVRFLIRIGETARAANELLGFVHATPRCEFWADSLSYQDADLDDVTGHRQVTDSYLASLARANDGRLATLDKALAARFPPTAELVTGQAVSGFQP
jgi:toxin-antitoxin system PIN domain toxin